MRAPVLVSLLLVACGGKGLPDDGELGGACYPNGTCNVTLLCDDGVCVAISDGGMTDGSPATDAPMITCDDDSQLEPNDTTTTAFQTPVASQTSSLNLAGLAICPAGDKDFYAVTVIAANTGITATVEYEQPTPALQASVLNSGGTPIANATPTGTPRQIRVTAPNAPVGTYYVQVLGGMNNYTLRLAVQ